MEALIDPFKVRDLKLNSQLSQLCFLLMSLSHPYDRRNCNIKVARQLFENVAKFGYWGMTEIRIKSWTN